MGICEAETGAVVLICHVVCDVVGSCAVSVACHCGVFCWDCVWIVDEKFVEVG